MLLFIHTTMETNIESKDIAIEASWKEALSSEFNKEYFTKLKGFIRDEYLEAQTNNKAMYPKPKDIFRAFDLCPFDQVKVVILGQDPYHGVSVDSAGHSIEQANGLSFAVHSGVPLPPSLKNIFKEIESDLGVKPIQKPDQNIGKNGGETTDGDLSRWAHQGVLLLNATLTVLAHQPGSHQKKGWEEFTDAAIRALSDRREHIVFLLWGNYAKQKGIHIDRSKHLVLEASHPSPFSVHSGFFGCKHFSRANAYLREYGLPEIDWR